MLRPLVLTLILAWRSAALRAHLNDVSPITGCVSQGVFEEEAVTESVNSAGILQCVEEEKTAWLQGGDREVGEFGLEEGPEAEGDWRVERSLKRRSRPRNIHDEHDSLRAIGGYELKKCGRLGDLDSHHGFKTVSKVRSKHRQGKKAKNKDSHRASRDTQEWTLTNLTEPFLPRSMNEEPHPRGKRETRAETRNLEPKEVKEKEVKEPKEWFSPKKGDNKKEEETEEECQGYPCHPMGCGSLHPAVSLPPICQEKDKEFEEALTGRLADRFIEYIFCKLSKNQKMVKSLGLCAQGNTTELTNRITHPGTKDEVEEASGEALKASVLQDIASAVDKLASGKSSASNCLRPPPELTEFLSWLLSEDPSAVMPEPTAQFHEDMEDAPRRSIDFLFRAGGPEWLEREEWGSERLHDQEAEEEGAAKHSSWDYEDSPPHRRKRLPPAQTEY